MFIFSFLAGKYHEHIQIEDNSTGYSYDKLFSRFLDDELSEIEIEDPYIRVTHQVTNCVTEGFY